MGNIAIQMEPSYGSAYKHRGVVYRLRGQYKEAIADIQRCIKLLPFYRPARLALLSIWKDICECVREVGADVGVHVPLDVVELMVHYTVYNRDEIMVSPTVSFHRDSTLLH